MRSARALPSALRRSTPPASGVAYVQGDANPLDDDERNQVWIYGEGTITKLSTVTLIR